jgi:hypothetical protein
MTGFRRYACWWLPAAGTIIAVFWLILTSRTASADTFLTTCTNSELQTAINAGGTVTFGCGVTTIAINTILSVNTAVTLDGGGQITLDGGTTSRVFAVGSGGNLTLKHLTVMRGKTTPTRAARCG